ncbi:MAG: hypothetical protein WCS34_03275 [Bacteroidales bacterium]
MNLIIAKDINKGFLFRPDSSLVRNQSEYYIPDYIESLSFAPVLCVKVFKPGKAISPKFILRHIDTFNYGVLLYPDLKKDVMNSASEFEKFTVVNSLDYSTIIPLTGFPFFEYSAHRSKYKEVSPLEQNEPIKDNFFRLFVNGHIKNTILNLPDKEFIFDKISEISKYYSLKIGDFILFELAPKSSINPDQQLIAKIGNDIVINFIVK